MNRRVVSMVLAGVLAIAVVAAVGVYEYRAGVARGVEMSGKLPAAPGWGGAPYPYYGYWHFHPFGFVFPLLLLFLVFGLARRMFGWGRWGGGPGYRRWNNPSQLDEWHRKAHESMPETQPR
jgi:hypothetical protein